MKPAQPSPRSNRHSAGLRKSRDKRGEKEEAGGEKGREGEAVQQEESNIQVVCRFRPFNKREEDLGLQGSESLFKLGNDTVKVPQEKGPPLVFKVSTVFGMNSTQEAVFQVVAQKAMGDLFSGYNSSIFAYGQTGSGKSWTMFGDVKNLTLRGLVPRCTETIFQTIKSGAVRGSVLTIQCSYCEIYQEQITDLFKPSNRDLPVREDPSRGVFVENLTHEYVSSVVDVYSLMAIGDASKKKCATKMNPNSSRSHCCFSLVLEQTNSAGKKSRAQLNLIDLAGSERVGKTQARGQSLEEAKKINLSLTALSQVINALADQSGFVPYRASKLTRLLQNSLGGNSKTSMIVACSPHLDNKEETITSLRFAQRCAQVRNRVKQNTVLTAEQLQAMLDQANREILKATGNTKKDISNIKDVGVQTEEADLAKAPAFGYSEVEQANDEAVANAATSQLVKAHELELQKKQLEIDTLNQRLLQANRRLLDEAHHEGGLQGGGALATARLPSSPLGPANLAPQSASARSDRLSEVRRKMSKLRVMASTPMRQGGQKKFSISDVRRLKARMVRRGSAVSAVEEAVVAKRSLGSGVGVPLPDNRHSHPSEMLVSDDEEEGNQRSEHPGGVQDNDDDDDEESESGEEKADVAAGTARTQAEKPQTPHVPMLFQSVEELPGPPHNALRQSTGTVNEGEVVHPERARLLAEKQQFERQIAAWEQHRQDQAKQEEQEDAERRARVEARKQKRVEESLRLVEEVQARKREADGARAEAAEVRLRERELELLTLKTQLQKGKVAFLELQNQLSETQYNLEQQDGVISRQQERLNEMEKQLRSATNETTELRDEVDELTAELGKLQAKLLGIDEEDDGGGASIVKPVQEGSVLSTFRAQQEATQLKTLFDIFSFGGAGDDPGAPGNPPDGVGANLSKMLSSFNPFG